MTRRKHCCGTPSMRLEFFAWGVLFVACGPSDTSGKPATVRRDSAGIEIIENDLERFQATCEVGAAPTVTIGTDEGDEKYQLYRVFGARRLSDGRIALVNQGSQQLRFYDQQGRFVSQTGRAGEGPGEFRDAFHLWVLPGDTVWVGDYRPWRFLVFGPDGQWVRTVQADPMYINTAVTLVLDDGRFIIAERRRNNPSGTQFELRHLTLAIHGADGALIDTIGTYPNGRWGHVDDTPGAVTLYRLFESFTRVTSTGSHIVVAHSSEPQFSILSATDEVRVERIVRWTPGDRAISSGEIEAERQRLAEPYEDLDPGMRRHLLAPLVSQERPVADQFPAFAAIAGGRDRRIWVREYGRPTTPEPHQWLAFDAEGRFQCRATIPAFDQILEFGANYLLVLSRDELGVERVFQYSLSPPNEND